MGTMSSMHGSINSDTARIVATFNSKNIYNQKLNDAEFDRFNQAFLRMLAGETRGGMSEFLFYTPKTNQNTSHHPIRGGFAWDMHTKNAGYQFMQNFGAAFDHAVTDGLLDLLPENIKICENGPGSLSAVSTKTGHVLKRLAESGQHEVQSYLCIDKSSRYAIESAYWVQNHQYGVENAYAAEGDFMGQTTTIKQGRGTPVVMMWGGPFANAPIEHNGQSALDYLKTYFLNMRAQHGLGSHFIIEVDLEDNINALEKSYAVAPLKDIQKRNFANFALSAFHRAAHNGTITNYRSAQTGKIASNKYPVNRLWRAWTNVETTTITIKNCDGKEKTIPYSMVDIGAIAKRNHIIDTTEGSVRITKGESFSQILSHKWSEDIWHYAAQCAGAETRMFRTGKKAILWGKFTNRPRIPAQIFP